jgi:hypothetical protein
MYMHISAIFKKGFYWRLCTDKLTRLTLYNKGRRSILSIHVLFVYGIIRSTSRARERRRGGGGTREDQCPSIAEAAGLDSEAGYSYSSSAILTSNNSDSSSEKGGETHEKNDF